MSNRQQRRARSKQLNQPKSYSWWDECAWVFMVGGFALLFVGAIGWQKQKKPPPSGSHIVSTQLLEENRPFEIAYGDDNAPVTIIEYASMSCGSCKYFHDNVVVQLKKIKFYNGKVRLLFRHYPLNKPALDAALLLSCVPQNSAIEALDTLFYEQNKWSLAEKPRAYLKQYFAKAGLDESAVETCLADEKQKEALVSEQSKAREELDVRSTPTVFINGALYTGSYQMNVLDREITAILKNIEEEIPHE